MKMGETREGEALSTGAWRRPPDTLSGGRAGIVNLGGALQIAPRALILRGNDVLRQGQVPVDPPDA